MTIINNVMKLKNISKILQWMDEHSVVGAAMRNRRIFTDKIQPSVACIGAIEAIASTSEVRNSMLDCISKRQLLPGTPMLLAHSPTRSGKPVASCNDSMWVIFAITICFPHYSLTLMFAQIWVNLSPTSTACGISGPSTVK